MDRKHLPTLKGLTLFRNSELVYINRSDELKEYCGIIHKHDFIEISYVLSGEGTHIVGDNKYEISKGDLFIINYDVPHGFFRKSPRLEEPIVYNCIFMPEFLDSSLISGINFQDITSSFLFKSIFPEDYNPSADLKLKDADFKEIGDLFNKMHSEYKFMKKGYIDIIRAHLIELIIKIFRYLEHDNEKNISSQNRNIVEKAVQYLKTNYNQDIKLEDLALKSFLSKNYFSKLFKDTTGISFSDYIQKIRVSEACYLLRNTDMKIIDVAYNSGFKDIKFFYEVFKKLTNKTPGEYRKQFLITE